MIYTYRKLFIGCFFIFTFFSLNAQSPEAPIESKNERKVEKYWFVLLKTNLKYKGDSATKEKLFIGHMSNIDKLYQKGILKVAGPFGQNDLKWRGILIFDCKTREEAEAYINTDPAIAAGILKVEILPWYSEVTGSFKHGPPEIN